MNSRYLRFGVAIAVISFLFVFFVPVIYDATMFQGGCGGGFACLANPSGWKSIGYSLFQWGGAYSPGGAGDPQVGGYTFLPDGFFALPDGSGLTAFGVILFIAFPMVVTAVGCLAPELVKRSIVSRVVVVLFGGFVFALSLLMLASMATEGLYLLPYVSGVLMLPSGILMTLFGLRPGLYLFSD